LDFFWLCPWKRPLWFLPFMALKRSCYSSFCALQKRLLLFFPCALQKGFCYPSFHALWKTSPGAAELSRHMVPTDLSALPSFSPFMALADHSFILCDLLHFPSFQTWLTPTLKMETVCYSKMLVPIYQIISYHITQKSTTEKNYSLHHSSY
jgi:hypothetical protein